MTMRKPINTLLLTLFMVLSLSMAFATPANNINFAQQNVIELDGSAGEILLPSHPEPIPFDASYIGNSNSGIFHYSWCRYVGRMSENHKVFFDSREEAIDAGYRPCKVCRP